MLLVEDNSDDAYLLQTAFQKAEIQEPLTVLGSGLEAIRYLSGEGKYENREAFPIPFLILLDLSLPGVDGFEVLRWLRKHPEIGRRITSLVLTGIESQSLMDEARSLGAQTVLVKPVKFEDLVALAKRLKTFGSRSTRKSRKARTSLAAPSPQVRRDSESCYVDSSRETNRAPAH